MKSLVTKRSVSAGPIGVSAPAGPSGAFHIPSITGVVPVQWNCTFRPATCGKRPVAIDALQNGLNPLSSALRRCSPVSVRITVRLPNGSTAKTSPQVIWPACSPAEGGVTRRSARRPPEFVIAASTPGYLSRIASVTRLPISDSCRRVGSRRMLFACVPMTWLRRTAVSASALSTIACTSARGATPRFFAVRVAAPVQTTSLPWMSSCATE